MTFALVSATDDVLRGMQVVRRRAYIPTDASPYSQVDTVVDGG